MERVKRLSIRMSAEELQKLDKALKAIGYRSRSSWVQEKIREVINEAGK